MSRQIGSLNRSLSYPSNFQRHSPILAFFDFIPYLLSSYTKKSEASESTKKLPITSNTNNTSQDNRNPTRIAPHLQNLYYNQPLSLVPRNYRNTTITGHIHPSNSYPQSPASHIVVHERNINDTYEQIVE